MQTDGRMPLKVFLVEDSALIRERLLAMLDTIAGTQTVGSADRADDAIRRILDAHPDTVVLDLQLAQGSGFDVLRALHAQAPSIDVLMLTNFPAAPYRRIAERLGARHFFDKTTEFERVREVIAEYAARHPLCTDATSHAH